MKVIVSSLAKKQLKKLSRIDQIVVVRKLRGLEKETDSKKLKGYKNIHRVRVGDLRIVYRKTKEEIFIILIRHRKDVYRLVKRLLS